MAVQMLTLAGKRFVLLPENEYRKLRRGGKNGSSRRTKSGASPRKHRMTRQDRGDVAEAKRRAGEPTTSFDKLRRELGLR